MTLCKEGVKFHPSLVDFILGITKSDFFIGLSPREVRPHKGANAMPPDPHDP